MSLYSDEICRQYDDMLNFAISLHRHKDDAHDTVQHVVMKFLEKDGRYKIPDLRRLLLTSIKNRYTDLGRYNIRYIDIAQNHYRSRVPGDPENYLHEQSIEDLKVKQAPEADQMLILKDIQAAIDTLPTELALIIRMRIQGYKYDEIAVVMHCRMESIKAKIFRARSKLKVLVHA